MNILYGILDILLTLLFAVSLVAVIVWITVGRKSNAGDTYYPGKNTIGAIEGVLKESWFWQLIVGLSVLNIFALLCIPELISVVERHLRMYVAIKIGIILIRVFQKKGGDLSKPAIWVVIILMIFGVWNEIAKNQRANFATSPPAICPPKEKVVPVKKPYCILVVDSYTWTKAPKLPLNSNMMTVYSGNVWINAKLFSGKTVTVPGGPNIKNERITDVESMSFIAAKKDQVVNVEFYLDD